MRRQAPPELTGAFHEEAFRWLRWPQRSELRTPKLEAGCWLAQFDQHEHPCTGRLEAFHFIGRQQLRRVLRDQLVPPSDFGASPAACMKWVDDLVELAEWDPRNGAPACTEHHRRFDSHATPALVVPVEALPPCVLDFIFDWGLEFEAERKFGGPLPEGSLRAA